MTRAVHIADRDAFMNERRAGSFWVSEPDPDDQVRSFWYCCPCGCGRRAPLLVGEKFKPEDGPSWNWNGSLDQATLTPSVNHVDHWHGFLTDGAWRSC